MVEALVDFMDQVEGDLNRRLAVLAILYYRRFTISNSPYTALTEIEQRMRCSSRDGRDVTTVVSGEKRVHH